MGEMGDWIHNMVVRATSSDGKFQASYGNRQGFRLRFFEGAYESYREDELGRQLTQAANHLWSGYQDGLDSKLAEVLEVPKDQLKQTTDAVRRRFRTERDATLVEGMSEAGIVYVCHTGRRDWRIVLRNGELSKLDEERFCFEVADAYRHMWEDGRVKTARLREKHYASNVANSVG